MARINYADTFDYAFDEDGSDGFNSWEDLEIIVGHVSKPLAPNMTESYQDVPARYGGVFLGTHYGERQFDIPITIMAEDRDEYNRKLKNLTNALINTTDDIAAQYPLRFNDDPDVMYYGHFTAIPTPTFINDGVQDCQTTLTFMLADPRGFMPTKSIKITNNDQTIVPEGNMTVKPIIHIIPKKPLYYVGYETNDEYVAVGYNTNQGNTITTSDGTTESMTAHQKLQVDDPCNTMATWFQAGSSTQSIVPYRGALDGKATAHGNSIMVAKDSKGHYDWGTRGKHKDFYGPVVLHNGLPKITPYWKVSVRLHHEKQTGAHNSRSMGKVEAYLLDNDGQIRGRMGIQDYDHGRMPVAYIQLGTSFKSSDKGKYYTIFYNRGNAAQRKNLATTYVKIPFEKKEVKTSSKKKKNATASRSYMATVQREAFKAATKKTTKKKTKKKTTKKKVVKKKSGGKTTKKVSKPKTKTKSKAVKKYIETYKKEYSYNNADAYSKFWGEFTLERYRKSDKAGNTKDYYRASIVQWNLETGLPYSATNDDHTRYSKQDIQVDSKFNFSLANIGVFFAKHDITEDLAKPTVAYKSDFLTLTDYKEWASDGSNDPDDTPHVIASAGEEIIIDTGAESVTVNGRKLDKYASWLSTFPGITGGVPQTLHFYPDPAQADITIDYKPAIK
ncbi:distal tail protein Dit [Levilactobacillus brevis]